MNILEKLKILSYQANQLIWVMDWETKRRRGKGYDWIIVKLAKTGFIENLIFKLIILKAIIQLFFLFKVLK